MKGYIQKAVEGKDIFVGIDLHRARWHVTVRTADDEVCSRSLPGEWEALRKLLLRFKGAKSVKVTYEAGCFGYWLHERLVSRGYECIVAAPSRIPRESGNRVKTDPKDSRKLAYLLATKGLNSVWVPSRQELCHRQVIRRRGQLMGDRVRVQNRIKGELRFFGIPFPEVSGQWSKAFVKKLWEIDLGDRFAQQSFEQLLKQYEFLAQQIVEQTRLLRELSQTDQYRERVKIAQSAPGIGLISAMQILLELQDMGRFRRGYRLGAYVGLTPSQYSSGERTRMGRITRAGKGAVRAALVEASWTLIRKDKAMEEKYERIKARRGGKRAIVAIARMFLLRLRRMLLDGTPYAMGLIG
jgi:transposase